MAGKIVILLGLILLVWFILGKRIRPRWSDDNFVLMYHRVHDKSGKFIPIVVRIIPPGNMYTANAEEKDCKLFLDPNSEIDTQVSKFLQELVTQGLVLSPDILEELFPIDVDEHLDVISQLMGDERNQANKKIIDGEVKEIQEYCEHDEFFLVKLWIQLKRRQRTECSLATA